MNRSQLKYLQTMAGLLLFLLGVVSSWFIFVWLHANWQQQLSIVEVLSGRAGIFLLLALGLLLGVGLALNHAFQSYVFAANQLAEEMTLILTVNPAHRVEPQGPVEMRQFATAINAFADRFQALLADEQEKILRARADLEEEKNRLAALMSELTEGVLVCNVEGQILLYNNRARQVLSQAGEEHGGSGFVGLGRSIFGLIDRNSISHALENLHYRLEKQSSSLTSHFVTTAKNGQLLRVTMAPVLDQQKQVSGFVLTLEDITQQVETDSRRDILLRSLTEGIRASLGSIRAAIETMVSFPEMDANRLSKFKNIISDESLKLSFKLNQTMSEYSEVLKAQWQLEEMQGSDMLLALQRKFEDKLGITTDIEAQEENLWLKVDSYSVMQAMTYVMRQLEVNFGVKNVTLHLKKSGRFAVFDMVWNGAPIDTETLWSWQNQALIANGEGTPLTLKEVAERHGGEVWCQSDKKDNTSYFRLLLPTTQPKSIWSLQVTQQSRPEYYDFDLFHRASHRPDLDNRPLLELVYTAFDTETTGLNPAGGDEIISIGAVRIVNGRLLQQEVFDQLIDPKRVVPRTSTAIHGIAPEMLKNQPTIDHVLPQFYRFAEETILVGHNAAFDMRMLQLKEAQTGIKFVNPVLDTLLLAAVVHPNQDVQSLEAIAGRLGLNVIGRHTALGDAIVTGEIFLKLLPLLAEQGITTLKEARAAAEKTYLARLSY
jgi:DNA polymerase-3 subunit epsilon